MNQKTSIKKAFVFTLFIVAAGNKIEAQQAQSQTATPAQAPVTPKWVPEMTEYYSPEVPLVTAGKPAANAFMTAPSDAIILFDGKDLSKWKGRDGGPAKWDVKDGAFTVKKRTGDISTTMDFNDFQLHIEWLVPASITGAGQKRGNSGIFLQGIYEIQVLDNYNNENKTYVNGQAGSIYKQTPPLKNVVNAPGQWNSYDIIYTAPRFKEDSTLFSPAYVTLVHNGVVIQNHTQLKGNTPYIGLPSYKMHGRGPIKLQDHGDPSEPISYRNIWIREL
jgi:hypothetical protein